MRIQTIEIYSFEELEEAIQKKVLASFRYNFLPSNWATAIVGSWKSRLEAMGFQQVQIRFSISSSQGDGASFTATGIDLPLLKDHMQEEHLRLSEKELSWDGYGFFIKRINHRYFHEKSVTIEMSEHAQPLPEEEKGIALLTDKLFTKIHNLAIQLYTELFQAYSSYFEDAYVCSELVRTKMEFYKNGILYIGR